jgi:hypothetical protein
MVYRSIHNTEDTMTCECGKKFTCWHNTHIGEAETNHCTHCNRGNWGDMCKGKCPECHEKDSVVIDTG